MEETHEFLIPDYFPSFSCKMGSCRTACCEGWPVSVSMENYFRLLGVECKKELRTRLDCGMRIVDYPTPEEYARFNPRYDGNCPMRKTDGRCGLQCELGEDALPDVCFLYPRGVRAEGGIYECSCANSCEAVAELLFNRTEPIAFSKQRLTLRMPPEIKRSSVFETFGREQDIRLYFISVIQNRAYTLPQRFLYLGEVLDRMDNALKTGDTSRVDEILRSGHDDRVFRLHEITPEHLRSGFTVEADMLALLDRRSDSIRACGEEALDYFGADERTAERYRSAKEHFESAFPNWGIFFENLLVNHMFFSCFPFQDRPESFHDEFIAICAVYSLMRFLALGHMVGRDAESELVDVMSAVFRLVDHTDFDRYAAHMLKGMGCTDFDRLYDLISL